MFVDPRGLQRGRRPAVRVRRRRHRPAVRATSARSIELSDLFARVVSRSGGRARFLFVCASERLHAARRPRAAHRLAVPAVRRATSCRGSRRQRASQILDRMLSLSGVAADPALAEAVVQGIGARPAAARRGSPDRRDGDARSPDHLDARAASSSAARRSSSRRGCTRRAGRPATSARRCACAPSCRGRLRAGLRRRR